MHLSKDDEKILNGEQGTSLQAAMQHLVKLGDSKKAERLTAIQNAHIGESSYHFVQKSGVKILRELANNFNAVNVSTTLGPQGLGTEAFLHEQKDALQLFQAMSIKAAGTCAPPMDKELRGVTASWNGVAAFIASSIYGLKTNALSWDDALASALLGKTPEYGLLLEENREPTLTVHVVEKLFGYEDYEALGYHVGREFPDRVPSFVFESRPRQEHLRGLASGLSIFGKTPLFSLDDFTDDDLTIEFDVLDEVFSQFRTEDPEAALLGCPHASQDQLKQIGRMIKGHNLKGFKSFIITTSEPVQAELEKINALHPLETAGAKIAQPFCYAASPFSHLGFKSIITNSLRIAENAKREKIEVQHATLDDILNQGF